ncbi:SH3 domain-containing protein 19 [Trichomycterus rosablanca]|uniref:SH3 domain-containing protein 19 n=1 Tax=Trichomycterus rosablanca TaxID=2290929 RepID=UPI002F3532CF
MAGLYSERNIRARIQEFENQVTTEETSVPTPRPRNSRPAVGTKPSVPPRASISSTTAGETDVRDETNNYFNEVLDDHINPTPTYWRPQLSTKPSLNSFDQVKPLIKSPPQLPSRSSLRRSNTLNSRDEEDGFNSSPFSPTTLSKQILNVNNHNNSAQNDYMDAGINWTSAAIPRPVGRKPTIIRVPTRQEDEMTFPPALPVQKAIGGPPPSLRYKESFGYASEPNLPPRPGVGKQFPPRPPPAKSGPGRPPPPRKDGIQRNSSMLQSQQTQRTTRKVSRKGPVLPPRPNPGHRLYNSYTLEIPHGIAEFDHNGMHTGELSFQKNEVLVLLNQKDSNTFECQVGDAKGTVQKSHMKIITPLSNYCHEVQPVPQQSSSHPAFGSSRLLKVQALYDFTPEGPGELGLRAGDIITDVEQLDSEWYLGTCRGMTGFFPINYVKPLSGSPAPPPSPTPAPAPAKPAAHNVRGPRCVARFDFEADESSELSFTEGEVIRLLEYVGEEWARGEIGSHQGIFPLNFVEVVEDLPSPSVKNQPRIPLPGMAASNNKQAAASTPKHVKVERFLALYDFNTETDGDLSFYRGDVIELIEHIDEEWSQGRLNGKEGIFPTSFTQPHTGGFLSR